MAAEKAALRRVALAARRALSPQAREAAARSAAGHAINLLSAVDGIVALYVPVRGEIDTGPLAEALAGEGRRLALPVTPPDGQPLCFRAWTPGDPLVPGRFGIPEPGPRASDLVPDVIVVPCVAFDARAWRLGYGGGFYDRTLAALREGGAEVLALGLAFACQGVAALPCGPHDIQLGMLATEGGPVFSNPVAQVIQHV